MRKTAARMIGTLRGSLAIKLMAMTALILALLFGANAITMTLRIRSTLTAEFVSKGRAISLSLAESSVEALLFRDISQVQSSVDGYLGIPGVLYIVLSGAEGNVLLHSFTPTVPAGYSPVEAKQKGGMVRDVPLPEGRRAIEISDPILFGVMGRIHVGMDAGIIAAEVRKTVFWLFVQSMITLLLGMLLIAGFTRRMLRPVGKMVAVAEEVSRGDLSDEVPVKGIDEVAHLGVRFNEMILSLRQLVGELRRAHGNLEEESLRLRWAGDRLVVGSSEQQQHVDGADRALEEAGKRIDNIDGEVQELTSRAREAFEAVQEMNSSITGIAAGAESLLAAVETVSSAVREFDLSLMEADSGVRSLSDIASSSSSAITEMEAALSEVGRSLTEAIRFSEEVNARAGEGQTAVDTLGDGMEVIRQSTDRVKGLFSSLHLRLEEIGDILTVIETITEQTGLLAFNATILAAQAGERGKGFAVVADEMRSLSEFTQESTKKISSLITGIKSDSAGTSKAVDETQVAVARGRDQTKVALNSLRTIVERIGNLSGWVEEIGKATEEQIAMGRSIKRESERINEVAAQLAEASGEQRRGSRQIVGEVESIRNVAVDLTDAVRSQKEGTASINATLEAFMGKMEGIRQASTQQREVIRNLIGLMATVRDNSRLQNDLAGTLANAVAGLKGQSQEMRSGFSRFILPDQDEEDPA
jgi:methyl-accepting chemotaxis protein